MPTFSKFITGRRGSQQLVDSDGYIYSRKKDKDSALKSAWRCSKHCIPTKCPCLCYLTLSDNTLTLSKKTHTHEADIAAPERQEVLVSLKRKAAEQPLSATQNLISEALGFHRGFKSRVHRPKPSVQEYVRAIKEQQVITDFHIDRLSVGKTPTCRYESDQQAGHRRT